MPERIYDQDHYEVLGLPSTNRDFNEKAVKLAYRRALLLHHPDKSGPISGSKHTVDQMTSAYKTLADPVARSKYDRSRALRSSTDTTSTQNAYLGLETVDLDELLLDEAQGMWHRGCRCGKDRAFVIIEKDLEANADDGEIVTGCQGCSLWLRVTFAVAEDG